MKILNFRNKKVSVLIANYNNSIYLKRCIKSVEKQNYKNIQIIIVDDNSSYNSLTILKKYKKIILIKNKKKSGIGSYDQLNAYRLGLSKATGDVIFFLDSDDFFKKNKIMRLLETLDKKAAQIYFDLPVFYFSKKNNYKNKFFQKKLILSPWPRFSPQSCICIRKKYLHKIIKIISIKKFPDVWMDFRIAIYVYLQSSNINILNEYLTFYQQSKFQVSNKYKFLSKKWWERRLQAHEYFNYVCKKLNKKRIYTLDFLVTIFVNKFLKPA
jgi:glycosyltransferase involved in cell wall biosynthesis